MDKFTSKVAFKDGWFVVTIDWKAFFYTESQSLAITSVIRYANGEWFLTTGDNINPNLSVELETTHQSLVSYFQKG